MTGWYPYPFLDHGEHGWGYVLGVCAGILVLFFAVFAGDAGVRPAAAPGAGADVAAVTGS